MYWKVRKILACPKLCGINPIINLSPHINFCRQQKKVYVNNHPVTFCQLELGYKWARRLAGKNLNTSSKFLRSFSYPTGELVDGLDQGSPTVATLRLVNFNSENSSASVVLKLPRLEAPGLDPSRLAISLPEEQLHQWSVYELPERDSW